MIYDELDLTLGTFKIRERGSPAGHNGARSVTGALGSQEWLRLRIGVGLDLPPEAVAAGGGRRPGRDYLLSPMRKADLTVLDEVLDRVATATRRILEDGTGSRDERVQPRRKRRTGIRDQGTGISESRPASWELRTESCSGLESKRLRRKRNTRCPVCMRLCLSFGPMWPKRIPTS